MTILGPPAARQLERAVATARNAAAEGARTRPNIHWRKDRGRDPYQEQAQYPSFWHNGGVTAERANERHFSHTSISRAAT